MRYLSIVALAALALGLLAPSGVSLAQPHPYTGAVILNFQMIPPHNNTITGQMSIPNGEYGDKDSQCSFSGINTEGDPVNLPGEPWQLYVNNVLYNATTCPDAAVLTDFYIDSRGTYEPSNEEGIPLTGITLEGPPPNPFAGSVGRLVGIEYWLASYTSGGVQFMYASPYCELPGNLHTK
jgi:hypothetical protein